MPKIHPTAIVHGDAQLGEDVEIGPHSVVESGVAIGRGSVLREHVVIRRGTTLGEGNLVDAGTVLGGEPQDRKWDSDTVSYLRIGDHNVFREGVTISRGSTPNAETVVGNRCYWMTGSHAGHDATIGDHAILCNGAIVGGHATIGPRVFLSGHVAIHQFTWVGEGAIGRGHGAVGMHVLPFALFAEENNIAGMNIVGMRRANLSAEQRNEVKEAFRLAYRAGLTPTDALKEMDQHEDWSEPAGKVREFLRKVLAAETPYNRGLCPMRRRSK